MTTMEMLKVAEMQNDLIAKIERLTAALKEISAMGDEHDEWDGANKFRDVRDFARRILEQETGRTK